ncbi:Sp110 nuclear body protein [Anabarilius grahami]|uniref:Sp110 nuclear body protein n=1 Tax=Anabarilius grahami TaxID=495550 RepID=A0A3N0Y9P2_ANAGA|nr:Sp110 nuclear body protein [Anabarilius grahami]
MEVESVTDTESESESDWNTLNSTGSESLSENDTEKRGKKREKMYMKKQSCKQPGPSSPCTPSKKRQAKESSQYESQNQSELVVTCGDKEGVLYVEKFNDSTDTSQYLSEKYQNKLPVTCGDKKGVLYVEKYNDKQKCILSKGQWFKPNEFERFGGKERCKNSTKSIFCDGIQLRKLIENDDVCFVCDSGGDLVCCDECPQAFHSHCHLPAADGDSLGSKWSCTFCVMKNMEDSSQKTQQEVLSSPVSQYTLVSGYNICGPMMLGRVKLNLENNDYQTVQELVTDIEQIFNNCCTSNGDNDSSKMTSRLKEAFKKEFETVFKLL